MVDAGRPPGGTVGGGVGMRRLTMPVGAIMTEAQSRAGQDVGGGAESG